MPIDGVLFDLDETLIDRSASLITYAHHLWRRLDGELALDEAAFVDRVMVLDGGGYAPRDQFFAELAALLDSPRLDAPTLRDHYDDTVWEFPLVAAGALAGLRGLAKAGISIGVVTNGRTETQTRKLENSGLMELIDAWLISEAFGARKPDPGIFLGACARLRIDPMRSWLVGDHPEFDILGANEVGLKTIWLERKIPWPSDQPRVYEARVSDLADAFSFLRTRISP